MNDVELCVSSDGPVFNEIYIKPWARIGPYLIGLILAYILFKKIKIKSVSCAYPGQMLYAVYNSAYF